MMDQTGGDVIFRISGVACFCTPKHFFHYYLQMFSMSGESETNAHDRREVGVTTLPMTDVSSAFWAPFLTG